MLRRELTYQVLILHQKQHHGPNVCAARFLNVHTFYKGNSVNHQMETG